MQLTLLQSLVEWQLQDSNAIRSIVEQFYKNTKKNEVNPLEPVAFGVDSEKRAYWQFGGEWKSNIPNQGLILPDSPWLWREKTNVKSGCQWATGRDMINIHDNESDDFLLVCRNLNELREFSSTLSTSNRSERNLLRRITDELIPLVEEKQRIQEKKDRAKARQVAMELAFTPRELRPRDRRKRTRYTYDDMFADVEEDIDDEYSESLLSERPERPERPKPTRTSSRLNPGLLNDNLDIEDQWQTQESVNIGEADGEKKQEVEGGDIHID
ncbi:hypothetical protein DFQ28_004325 [Apophysomyces sp. BC1034]|nr:hypothetical protein DFQ30_006522 [Apophysomyces sp. BC1015]KAG0177448.1 hypothetical protein DFQ29_004818 [Apophysomyces sp. BC1021]KAG0188808.1 hypothetical protein DFQ28_004325 [Apophysomyces sp. BC1034]